MSRHSRIRRIAKWSGVVTSIFILLTWIVAGWWCIAFVRPTWILYVRDGALAIQYDDYCGSQAYEMIIIENWRESNDEGIQTWKLQAPGSLRQWFVGLPSVSTTSTPAVTIGSPTSVVLTKNQLNLVVPIWILFAAVALPTAYLFRSDHRPPPGHCQKCSYDLQGNVSGVCPECGRPTSTAT